MGVRGLWKILRGDEVEESEMKGKTLCIDGNFVLFGCLGSSDVRYVTEYTLSRVGKLMSMGVECIFVFDGKRPLFKRQKGETRGGRSGETEDGKKQPGVEEGEKQPRVEEPVSRKWEWDDKTSMDEFSEYQVGEITKRRKYFEEMKQNRMHGDSSLFYQIHQKRSTERPRKAAKVQKDYSGTEKEIEELKKVLFDGEVAEDLKRGRKEARNSGKCENLLKKPISTLSVSGAPRGEGGREDRGADSRGREGVEANGGVQRVFVAEEKPEYLREAEKYSIPAADLFLAPETEGAGRFSMGAALQAVTELLNVLCVKYAISPAESDAVYANIEKAVRIDGVITDDSDILLFSTSPVYRHVFKRKERAKVYRKEGKEIGYSWGELVLLSWMLGSDYSGGIRGVGVKKAQKIIRGYREAGRGGVVGGVGVVGKAGVVGMLNSGTDETHAIGADIIDSSQDTPLDDPQDTSNCKEKSEGEREIRIEDIKTAFRKVCPEVEVEKYIPQFLTCKRIYSETDFKVQIENLKAPPIDITRVSVFLKKRTHWREEDALAFLGMLEEQSKSDSKRGGAWNSS